MDVAPKCLYHIIAIRAILHLRKAILHLCVIIIVCCRAVKKKQSESDVTTLDE